MTNQVLEAANHVRSPPLPTLEQRVLWLRNGFALPGRSERRVLEENNGAAPQFNFGQGEWYGMGRGQLLPGTLKEALVSGFLRSSSVTTCSAPRLFSLLVSSWRLGLEAKHNPRPWVTDVRSHICSHGMGWRFKPGPDGDTLLLPLGETAVG